MTTILSPLQWRQDFARLILALPSGGAFSMDDFPVEEELVQFETEWDGVPFRIWHSLVRSPWCLFIECRLGPLPEHDADRAMWRLLAIQRELTAGASAVLGLDEESGDVCQSQGLPVAVAQADDLQHAMKVMWARAAIWRECHFLDEDEDTAPAGPARRMSNQFEKAA